MSDRVAASKLTFSLPGRIWQPCAFQLTEGQEQVTITVERNHQTRHRLLRSCRASPRPSRSIDDGNVDRAEKRVCMCEISWLVRALTAWVS